jgi:outer membrane protein assembly factor BamB
MTSIARNFLVTQLRNTAPGSKLGDRLSAGGAPERLDLDRFEHELSGHSAPLSAREQSLVDRVRAALGAPSIYGAGFELLLPRHEVITGVQLPITTGAQERFRLPVPGGASGAPVLVEGEDSEVLYQPARDGTLHVFDRDTGEAQWSVSLGGAGLTHCPVISPDAKTMYLSRTLQSGNAEQLAIDLQSRKVKWCMASMEGAMNPVTTPRVTPLGISPDGALLCFAVPRDRRLTASTAINGHGSWELELPGGLASSNSRPLFTPDGARVVFSYTDDAQQRRLAVIDAQTGQLQWNAEVGEALECQPALSPDGQTVYAGARDALRAYDLATGGRRWESAVSTLDPRSATSAIAVSFDGRRLAVQDHQGTCLIDASSGRALHAAAAEEAGGHHRAPAFTPDHTGLLLHDQAGRFTRLRLANLEEQRLDRSGRAEVLGDPVEGYALSGDGRWAYQASSAELSAVRLDAVKKESRT